MIPACLDSATSGLHPLLSYQGLRRRKDSVVMYTSMWAYQSGFISGQFRLLSSIWMGMPGAVYLRERIDFILRGVVSRCVVVGVGTIGLVQRCMSVLIGTPLAC